MKFDNEEEKENLEVVITKFKEFFVGETHEVYEAYKFHIQKQKTSDSIETYVAALQQLEKGYNFGEMWDWLI